MAFSTTSTKKSKYDFSSITEENPLVVKNVLLLRLLVAFVPFVLITSLTFLSYTNGGLGSLTWALWGICSVFTFGYFSTETATWNIYSDRAEISIFKWYRETLYFKDYTHFKWGGAYGIISIDYRNEISSSKKSFPFPFLSEDFHKKLMELHAPFMVNENEEFYKQSSESVKADEYLGNTEEKRLATVDGAVRLKKKMLWLSLLLVFLPMIPGVRFITIPILLVCPLLFWGIMLHVKNRVGSNRFVEYFELSYIHTAIIPVFVLFAGALRCTLWKETQILLIPSFILFSVLLFAYLNLFKTTGKSIKRVSTNWILLILFIAMHSWSLSYYMNLIFEEDIQNIHTAEVVEVADTVYKKKECSYIVVQLPPEAIHSRKSSFIKRDTYQIGDSVQLKEYIGLFGVCTGYELVEGKNNE